MGGMNMKRKICAVLLVLGMILCQIPQTAAASENVAAAEEAVPVVEMVEAAPAEEESVPVKEEAEIPSEPGEQNAEAGTAAAEDAAQTDGESGTADSTQAQEPSGNVEETGAKAPEKKAVSPDGESGKVPVSESGTEKTAMPKTSAGANAGLVGAPKSVSDLTPVDTVTVGVVVPNAGDTTESAPGAFALGSGYHITTANWCDEEGNELGSTVTFAAGETYYIKASASSEEGYFFRQGSDGTSFEADGGELKSSWIMNWTDSDGGAHSYAEIIIAVRAAAQTSFFGVLISDAEGTANKGGSYWMDYAGMEGSPSRTSSSNNFVEDGSDVYLEAYPADGYKFLGWYQGDPDRAGGKLYTGEPLTTDSVYEFDAPIILTRPYICAVFDVDESPQGDQVQMWVGNTEVIGPDSSAQGGKVAVKYEPSYDIYPNITAKDGTNFVAGEILPFYKGDECTVYQQADEGFHFVGWYHVNIEWGPGETLAWEGSPISTADSFTYKPGQTVVAGDSEPLRYVCAVFEADEVATHTVTFNAHGGTPVPDTQTVPDGGNAVKPADPSRTDLFFNGWFAKEAAQITYEELYSPFDFAGTAITGDTELHATYYGRMKVNVYDLTSSTEYEGGRAKVTNVMRQGNWPSTNWSGLSVLTETPVTLTAFPDEGYEFVGWSPSFSEADIVSTDQEYTFTFQENTTMYALFREETVTVTFDAKGGNPVPEAQTISKGGKAVTPARPTKTGWSLYGWFEDEACTGDPVNFSAKTFDADTTLYACWISTVLVMASDVTDPDNISTSVGGKVTVDNSEAWATVAVQRREGARVRIAAQPDEGYRFIGWASKGPTNEIFSTDPVYYIESFDRSLSPIFAVFEKVQPVLTLHWTSIDGDDLMDPIAIKTKPGTKFYDAMKAAGIPYDDCFEMEGYEDFGYRSLHSVNSYADEDAFYDDCIGYDYVVEENVDIYVVMFKELDAAEITIAAPACTSTAPPSVSVTGENCDVAGARWITDMGSRAQYLLILIGGYEYLAEIRLGTDFRCFLADDAQITVNGGTLTATEPKGDCFYVFASVAVDHTPGDPVSENTVDPSCTEAGSHDDVVRCAACGEEISRTEVVDPSPGHTPGDPVSENTVDPTCTEAGSHDEVTRCAACGEEISRTEVVDPALDHDWGAWKVTKEPNETEDGEETRNCTRCTETETRPIPHLGVEYRNTEGDGSFWEKGSTESLRFVYKRNVSDETAFSHFTGITVDENTVDPSDYTAVSGSVVLTLKPEYLETLSVGQHSLTVMFDDADAVTVSFSVTEKEAAPAAGNTNKKDTQKTDTQKSGTGNSSKTSEPAGAKHLPKTGDDSSIAGWTVMLAAAVISILFILIRRRRGRISRTT